MAIICSVFTDISSQSSSVVDHERDYFYPTTHFLQVSGKGYLQSSLRFFHISVAIRVNIRTKLWFVVSIDVSIAFKKQKKYFGSNSGIYYSKFYDWKRTKPSQYRTTQFVLECSLTTVPILKHCSGLLLQCQNMFWNFGWTTSTHKTHSMYRIKQVSIHQLLIPTHAHFHWLKLIKNI